MTVSAPLPLGSHAPPRYRNVTGGGGVRTGRPRRPDPLTPPDTLTPRFTHAAAQLPRMTQHAPRPSATPFTEPAADLVIEPVTAWPTRNSSWLNSPFRVPMDHLA
ncbi:hypothetical protein [Streptomyces sp. NPDC001787]|uniref:hypothetical protein n=1 Tax=Streptomyces sp. NPDC001787 TaxID=3154523 RepID=UPI00332DF9E5